MIIYSGRRIRERCHTPLIKISNQAVHGAVGEAAVGRLDTRLDDVDGSRNFLRAPAPR